MRAPSMRDEVVTEFALVERGEFLAKEGGDVVGLDGMDGSAYEVVVEGF